MANIAWKSNADIVNDLTMGAGGYVDENFIVRGFRPPAAVRSNDVDEEMQILFGDHYDNIRKPASADEENFYPPDYRGIQQMLQMVNDLEDGTKNTEASSADRNLPSPGDVITISKLNPNVDEFVPKNQNESTSQAIAKNSDVRPSQAVSSTRKLIIPDQLIPSTLDQPQQSTTDQALTKRDQSVHNSLAEVKLIPHDFQNNLSNDHIKKLSEKLKSKIDNASKSDTFQSKREKNVAIATLLKLHANKVVVDENEPTSSKAVTTPVLLPPDYYINKNPHKTIAQKETVSNTTVLLGHSASDIPLREEDSSLNKTLDISNTTLNNISRTASGTICEAYDAEKEIQVSIDKVTRWLNPTTSKAAVETGSMQNLKAVVKKPVSIFGPITFKKKENKTQSPVESKGSTTPKKTRRDSKEFVPSQNAAKRSEDYMKRIKEREIEAQKPKILTMANLEEELKARDEKIRSSLNNSFTNSNSS